LNWLTGKWDSTEVAINDAKLAVAQAAFDDAVREWNRLKNGPAANDIAAAQARVDALQATLNMSGLKSPIAGTVTEVNSMPADQVALVLRLFALMIFPTCTWMCRCLKLILFGSKLDRM